MDYRSELLARIHKALTGEWSVENFRANYYDFFLDGVPDYELSDSQLAFFARVQEKLDMVCRSPDAESRSYGWMDEQEFLAWLEAELQAFERFEHVHE